MENRNQTIKETSKLVRDITIGLGLVGSLIISTHGQKTNKDYLTYSGTAGFAIAYSVLRKYFN